MVWRTKLPENNWAKACSQEETLENFTLHEKSLTEIQFKLLNLWDIETVKKKPQQMKKPVDEDLSAKQLSQNKK